MAPPSRVLVAATAGQLVLLAGLAFGYGIGTAALVAAAAYLVGMNGLLATAMRRARHRSLGPADLVTLGRAGLVGSVTALVVDGLLAGVTARAALVGIAAVALVLDAVDGRVARRTGTVSALGARFDMEVDAFLVLVLSVHAAGIVGPWALGIGGMRYAFVAAGWALPWMRRPLPANIAAKTVAALQGVALVVASAEVLPHSLATGVVAGALALLCCSFGRDVARLWRGRDRDAPRVRPRPAVEVVLRQASDDRAGDAPAAPVEADLDGERIPQQVYLSSLPPAHPDARASWRWGDPRRTAGDSRPCGPARTA